MESVHALVDAGADVHEKNIRGETPLHWAILGRNLEPIRVLIEAGTDVHTKDDKGQTPLHTATKDGNWAGRSRLRRFGRNLYWVDDRSCAEVIRALIEAGSDVHAKDDAGKTPLDWAKNQEWDDPDAIELLSGAAGGNDVSTSD